MFRGTYRGLYRFFGWTYRALYRFLGGPIEDYIIFGGGLIGDYIGFWGLGFRVYARGYQCEAWAWLWWQTLSSADFRRHFVGLRAHTTGV